MRRVLIALVLIALGMSTVSAAPPKDTPAAHNTRTKKLQAKISVDFTETPLKDCLDELKKAIDEADAGPISLTLATGVSMNQKITYKATKKPLAEVLDGMFKKNGLGYIVVSKQGDRQDGWIQVRQGNERGYAEGDEPAPVKTTGKKPDKTEEPIKPTPKEAPATTSDDEGKAAAKLRLAQALAKDGLTAKAKDRLKDLIKQYPTTKAAADAKAELEKLEK